MGTIKVEHRIKPLIQATEELIGAVELEEVSYAHLEKARREVFSAKGYSDKINDILQMIEDQQKGGDTDTSAYWALQELKENILNNQFKVKGQTAEGTNLQG